MNRWIAASAAALLLAGCTAAPTPAPTPDVAPALHLVGLGDSIMAGTNCACDGPLAAYADRLEEDAGVRPSERNLAVPGWTTIDVLHQLRSDADARAAVKEADTVVVIVGANDLFQRGLAHTASRAPAQLEQGLHALGDGLSDVLDEVVTLREGRPTAYLVTGYWDVLAEPGQTTTWSSAAIGAVNATIADTARDAGMTYVDLAGPFEQAGGAEGVRALISDDGLHPNARGVEVIGEALAAASG